MRGQLKNSFQTATLVVELKKKRAKFSKKNDKKIKYVN